MQINMLALLHEQYRLYTTEIGSTHQELSKLYRRLARIELELAEREQRVLSRKQKKKLQWARSVANVSAKTLERRQAGLYDHIRQCHNLISSYETTSPTGSSAYHLPSTPWTAHLPPSPYGHFQSPYSPVASNPWTHATPAMSPVCFSGGVTQQRPQYWDLSMLRERRQSSPYAASADSGFNEPAMYGHPFDLEHEGFSDPDHVYAHELMSPGSTYSSAMNEAGASSTSSAPATPLTDASGSNSESRNADDVPELPTLQIRLLNLDAGRNVGAGVSGHKRRYSENAVQTSQYNLAAHKTHQHKRGVSMGPCANCSRNPDDTYSDEERHVAADRDAEAEV